MEIHLFSHDYKGLMISANDFEFYLSLRALIIVSAVALTIALLRRVKKVRGL